MIVRSIKYNNEVYLNAQDLISKIRDHKEKVGGSPDNKIDNEINNIYKLAHEHIIDIIELYKGGIYDNFN